MPEINPNKRRARIESYSSLPANQQRTIFPDFVSNIKVHEFRHLHDVEIQFKSPVTVITGSNRTGKSSILLCLGCSHYNFMTRNPSSGKYERTRWGDMMRFTSSDIQQNDWIYTITCRQSGGIESSHTGKRNNITKKWSGCAKKEGQIGHPAPHQDISPNGRHAYFIDLERIVPGRHMTSTIYIKVKGARGKKVNKLVRFYLSYILENNYDIAELGGVGEKRVYSYASMHRYSSFNTASGEDVLTRILIDIVEAKDNSLIMIEEIEIGLHPLIQRRLMDVIFSEANRGHKQFIITTHSSSVISSVKPESRILLRKMPNDSINVLTNVSVNGALSCMDSESYPLLSIYVEDDISKRLVEEAIQIVTPSYPQLRKFVHVVVIGAANKTYDYFRTRKDTDSDDKLKRGYACILDGDKQNEQYKDGSLQFPPQNGLFFHYSSDAPERMLLKEFLRTHPNERLQYHANDGNAHNLMQKIVDEGFAASQSIALEQCIECLRSNPLGQTHLENMANFILHQCASFSTDL